MKHYNNISNYCEGCGEIIYGNHRLCPDCQHSQKEIRIKRKNNKSEDFGSIRKSRKKDSGRKRRP